MTQLISTPGDEKADHKKFVRQSLYLSAGALIISVIAHFILDYNWLKIITNHIGGLGITVLFACLSGFLAGRKGYDFRKTFYIALFAPISLGIIVVIIFSIKSGFTYCGGGVVLLASAIFAMVSLFLKRKTNKK
ncbi:hypothetical protein ACFLTH_12820 [Bacteroidota bacterium]